MKIKKCVNTHKQLSLIISSVHFTSGVTKMFQFKVRYHCIWHNAFKLDTQLTWRTYRTTEFLQTKLLWEDELSQSRYRNSRRVDNTRVSRHLRVCILELSGMNLHLTTILNNRTSVNVKQYSNRYCIVMNNESRRQQTNNVQWTRVTLTSYLSFFGFSDFIVLFD